MEVGWPKHSSVGFRCHWRQMERSWQMMWSNVKVQYLSPVLLVPPNVSGIALELADDEEEEEEGIMASMSQKIGQVCWDVVHERLCRVLERAVKQSTRRASMIATVLDGSNWDLKPKSAKKKKKIAPETSFFDSLLRISLRTGDQWIFFLNSLKSPLKFSKNALKFPKKSWVRGP